MARVPTKPAAVFAHKPPSCPLSEQDKPPVLPLVDMGDYGAGSPEPQRTEEQMIADQWSEMGTQVRAGPLRFGA